MSKKIVIFTLILLLACAGVCLYMKVPEVQRVVATYTEDDFTEDNIYSDLERLSERLDQEIMKGSESFTIYLKDMDVKEINQINETVNGIFGSGATYHQVGNIGNTYKKVTITINRTVNYYVLHAYLNQEEIPDTETKAKELYAVVKQIMETQISDGMTDFEKEVALHDYLVKNCRYSEDTNQPAESDIYRAYGALVNGDAVCNGYAEALQLLFMCAGIDSEFVIGTANGIDHAWNLVKLDGKWYHLDATWNDPIPDLGEDLVHPYFNVSDEVIEESHIWDHTKYPVADSMEYNYYVKNELYFRDVETYKDDAYQTMIYGRKKCYEAVVENYIENEQDMQFIFENNYIYDSVNWQTFREGSYCVVVLKAD